MTTSQLSVYSLVQPAVVVRDIDAGVDRVHELFAAVPSERANRDDFVNAVYAFENVTFLEVLDGMREGHTRSRFLESFGAGLYMFCADLDTEDVDAVDRELERLGKRVVQRSPATPKVRGGWHIHPRDAGNLLILLACKVDPRDNSEWAGEKCADYVAGNTRFARELRGVIARTADPEAEAAVLGELGFPMQPPGVSGAWAWTGQTGTRVELWPADAWPGEEVTQRRDYALLFAARDRDALLGRFAQAGLTGAEDAAGGRWLSEVDPVLGVRIAVEP